MGNALDGIRQTVKDNRSARFAGLLHHIYEVQRRRAAYPALRRDAAPGVDGQGWQSYGQNMQANLLVLSDRLARGGCRPHPLRRVSIDKADGSRRPPTVGRLRLRLRGVPALEEKLVQRATVEVRNAAYEQDFIGFSYGCGPGRSAHNALDAVAAGVSSRKVNWMLDADTAKFFDTIEHDWLIQSIEHRVADARVVRLIKKSLHAGVLEEGSLTQSELGTMQGGSIRPLLLNTYLHYAFDLWARQWWDRPANGQAISQTFDFLGFTHCCGTRRKGKFRVLWLTRARAVVAGHGRYFGVLNNGARQSVFRFQVGRLWHRTLCRRSQTRHLSWRRMRRLVLHWLPVPHI